MVSPFVKGWLQRDSNAAGKWVEGLSGNTRDLAAREVAKFLVEKGDYDSARIWRDSIANEKMRSALRVP